MPPENYKTYVLLECAIGGRKTRAAGAAVKLQITDGAYADHRADITPPVWAGASSRQPGFATAAGLCCASLGFASTRFIRFPPAANVLGVDAENALSHQSASETNRPFKQLERGFIIHGEACWHCAAPSWLASLYWLDSIRRGFDGKEADHRTQSGKHAHQRIWRRAFRSHHCGRTRPPTEREPEALHRHGDEERELK